MPGMIGHRLQLHLVCLSLNCLAKYVGFILFLHLLIDLVQCSPVHCDRRRYGGLYCILDKQRRLLSAGHHIVRIRNWQSFIKFISDFTSVLFRSFNAAFAASVANYGVESV